MKKFKLTSLLFMLLWTAFVPLPSYVTAEGIETSPAYELSAETQSEAELVNVTDFKVIDGDTADFILDRSEEPSIKARILLIDAPEVRGTKPYAEEAKLRVQELFEAADQIQIEYEGPKKDAYQRDLVHVWVDGVLLQEILVSEGLAIARYIEDYIPNSKYAPVVFAAQDYAELEQLNVWQDGEPKYLAQAEYIDGRQNQYAEEFSALPEAPADNIVYVAPLSGEKYHLDPNCRGLRNAESVAELTLSEAEADGYTLCGYED